MIMTILSDAKARPVSFIDFRGLRERLANKKGRKYKNALNIIEKELSSMRIKFYSELTNQCYDDASQCAAAETAFKKDQELQQRRIDELKRRADEESKRLAQETADKLKEVELTNAKKQQDEAFDNVVDALKNFTAKAGNYITLLEEKYPGHFELVEPRLMLAAIKDFINCEIGNRDEDDE